MLDALEFFDDTETFLLMPPCFRRLSAPALAFEADLPRAAGVARVGVMGWRWAPLCTSLTVFSSAAVPLIPTKKLS